MPGIGLKVKPTIATSGPLAGYTAWYDASDAATITAVALAVSQWNDKSANGYHLTQGTGANQPLTGTDTINGLNVLKFVGATPSYMTNTAWPTLVQPYTSCAVVKVNNTAAIKIAVQGNSVSTAVMRFSTAEAPEMTAGTLLSGSGVIATSVIVTVANGASSAIFVDGASNVTGNANTNSLPDLRIGANESAASGFDGDIAEVIIYPSALGTTDRNTVEAYLKAKWSTP